MKGCRLHVCTSWTKQDPSLLKETELVTQACPDRHSLQTEKEQLQITATILASQLEPCKKMKEMFMQHLHTLSLTHTHSSTENTMCRSVGCLREALGDRKGNQQPIQFQAVL